MTVAVSADDCAEADERREFHQRLAQPGLVATGAAFALLVVNSAFTTMVQMLGAALALATT